MLGKMVKKYPWLRLVGFGLLALLVIKIYQGFKAAGGDVASAAEAASVAAQTGVAVDRVAVCKDVAHQCEVAIWNFHKVWWLFGIEFHTVAFRDLQPVIDNLNRLTTVQEAALTSDFYKKEAQGHSLRDDVKHFLSDGKQKEINSTVFYSLT